jgi:rare lipoprotein A
MVGSCALNWATAWADAAPSDDLRQLHRDRRLIPEPHPQLDRSGRKRIGKASFYARQFAGKKMADGTIMHPSGDNAASKTLPLGTVAKVTNLETGRSAVVTIRDRGPYVPGRIVDLSPATANEIGLARNTGVTRVAVSPIVVPLKNGELKVGEEYAERSYAETSRNN